MFYGSGSVVVHSLLIGAAPIVAWGGVVFVPCFVMQYSGSSLVLQSSC